MGQDWLIYVRVKCLILVPGNVISSTPVILNKTREMRIIGVKLMN